MNATIVLLLASTVPAVYVPQSAAQQGGQPRPSSRRHVDVSFEGLAASPRPKPGNDDDRAGISVRPPASSDSPFDCLESISDQATGGCLQASSSPTLGLLHPYPGLNNAFVPRAVVGGGEDNRAPGSWSTVGGGRNNTASGYSSSGQLDGHATVGGGYCNTASGTWGTVAGGAGNTASGSGATVGGGGGKPSLIGNLGNTAAGDGATVGGGFVNEATSRLATVGGGFQNSAAGVGATIGGGGRNVASGGDATVAGGVCNTASGFGSAVGGGGGLAYLYGYYGNVASGYFATIPGGRENTASGHYTFAAGRRARASHDGAFVWADSRTGLAKTSSTADEFNVYASGGVRLFTNSAATTGVLLAPGGSTWTMVSDRDAKENVEPVDTRAILEKVAALPVATWNYKAQDDSIRHMGPMAQDFHAAFGLGLGAKTIDTIDPSGVALAAIQGLNELVVEENADMRARLAEKEAELEGLREANEALAARLQRLEALLDGVIDPASSVESVTERAPRRTARRP